MKEGSTVPTAIAFVCFMSIIAFFVFFIKDTVDKNRIEAEKKEAAEVGELSDIRLNLGGDIYYIKCESTKSAKNLIDNLPLSIEFKDLENVGKSGNIFFKLVSEPKKIKKAVIGDVLLEGNSTVIIVDKTFKTNAKYTKIGHIDNLTNMPSGMVSGYLSVSD